MFGGSFLEQEAFTEDGVVYYLPHHEGDDRRLMEILRIAFSEAPAHYWQLVYGAVFESQAECEEYALRWHRGRLNDLGFPDREQAMRAYRPLALDDALVVDLGSGADGSGVVPAPQLPQVLAGTLLARAFGELPAARAADVLGYVLAVGNAVAIADRMPLSEFHSIDKALRKAVQGIDRGLEALAQSRHESPGHILDHTLPMDLFRIGATLDPSLRPPRALPEF